MPNRRSLCKGCSQAFPSRALLEQHVLAAHSPLAQQIVRLEHLANRLNAQLRQSPTLEESKSSEEHCEMQDVENQGCPPTPLSDAHDPDIPATEISLEERVQLLEQTVAGLARSQHLCEVQLLKKVEEFEIKLAERSNEATVLRAQFKHIAMELQSIKGVSAKALERIDGLELSFKNIHTSQSIKLAEQMRSMLSTHLSNAFSRIQTVTNTSQRNESLLNLLTERVRRDSGWVMRRIKTIEEAVTNSSSKQVHFRGSGSDKI